MKRKRFGFIVLLMLAFICLGSYYYYHNEVLSDYTMELKERLKLKKENDYLSERFSDYEYLKVKSKSYEFDNSELREIKKRLDSEIRRYETNVAIVIKRESESWDHYLEINKGSKAGVTVNTNVITAKGLLGKVIEVSEFSSKVELLSNQKYKAYIAVKVKSNNRIHGIIKGYDRKMGLVIVELQNRSTKLKKGEKVVTSGLGGVFLPNLEVGRIKEIKYDLYGLTQIAYLIPDSDLNDINYVLLLKKYKK